jgi:hypothetical protein
MYYHKFQYGCFSVVFVLDSSNICKKEIICNDVFMGDLPYMYGVTIESPYLADLLTSFKCIESL